MEQDLTIPAGERKLDAYLVVPDRPPGRLPAVVVIHEIFGPDAHIRDVSRRFAGLGYVAIAPNLFPPEIFSLMTPENIRRAMAAFAQGPPDLRANPSKMAEFAASQPDDLRPVLSALGAVQNPQVQAGYAEDLTRVTAFLRHHDRVDPDRIASVGFCFGGAMSGRLATLDPRLRAAVIFYGQSPPADRIPAIRAHVLGLYGGEDAGITNTVPALAEAMRTHGKSFESHVYPGAKHAFFNDTRPTNYHADSARDAWERVQKFLRTEFATAGATPAGGPAAGR